MEIRSVIHVLFLPSRIPSTELYALRHRDALNLHIHPLRQLIHSDAAPCRLAHKMFLILLVHRCEIDHIRNKNIDLDYFLNGRTSCEEDAFDVGNAGCCLLADAAFN